MTRKEARPIIKALGMTLRTDDGEHRVTFRAMSAERAEAMAYYTNDLEDAVNTAKAMYEKHKADCLAMPV